MKIFPNYEPPDTTSTNITVGVAPILVLLGFTQKTPFCSPCV